MNVIILRIKDQGKISHRNILGTKNLHEILSDRESISGNMQVTQFHSANIKFAGNTLSFRESILVNRHLTQFH